MYYLNYKAKMSNSWACRPAPFTPELLFFFFCFHFSKFDIHFYSSVILDPAVIPHQYLTTLKVVKSLSDPRGQVTGASQLRVVILSHVAG